MEAQRWFFNCAVCGAFKVRDLSVHLDGSLEQIEQVQRSYGSPGVAHMIGRRYIVPVFYTVERTPTTIEQERKCPCGAQAEASMIQGTISNKHVCDGACTGAHGDTCECSCGGANHGAAFVGAPTWYLEFKPNGEKKARMIDATPEAAALAKAEKAAKREARQAAREQAKRAAIEAETEAFRSKYPEVVAYLEMDHDDNFLRSLARQLLAKGHLSSRQVEAAERSIDRDRQRQEAEARKVQAAEERAVKLETASDLAGGRYPISGRIVKVAWRAADWPAGKSHDPDCGCDGRHCDRLGNWKMIVELPDGNRIWMPVPDIVGALGDDALAALGMDRTTRRYLVDWADAKVREGLEIICEKITVKVGDDPHFGFGSRATGVRVILPAARDVA